MRLAREWERIYYHRRDPGARHTLEKIIGRRGGKRAVQPAQRQPRQQANRVEMAGMIRDQNEGTITPQMLFADDLETAVGAEQSANDQGETGANAIDQHVGLARKIAEPLDNALVEISGGLVLPAFHRSLE
jgi:hypothetical protein